ncbi:aspartate carbamoyltransferase [Neofamilia massiliensis]|uniref:aspartate carbamoyltransferase n=1 Tax=Neofamilia massiliensis TaxID=1673724 RepID=UPI0006BB76BF|nr:aspartate carbamoyltransferase [Neofamilia massiliensis]
MLKGRNLVSPDDLSVEELYELMDLARDIIKSPDDYSNVCKNKILGTLFFEPSTRTRLSFESAMLRLGGQVIGFSEAASSSTAKGESLIDTIRTVGSYADILAMRNPKEGSAMLASEYTYVPLINAGDGGHYHPTQTLTDLLTIIENKGTFENLNIGLCGDLKFGRTVHSLLKTMNKFKGNKFYLISPDELRIPSYVMELTFEDGADNFVEVERLEEVIHDLDILYMTRVQKERFFNEADYVRLKDSYILGPEKMSMAKDDMIVLHPLPRVNEIEVAVDSDPRAKYFEQVKNGMYVRMALIMKLLGVCK